MKFSRFQPLEYTTPEPEKPHSDWFQEEIDTKFRLSLSQTREELRQAMRYKAAWESMIQEISSIAGGNDLPLVKERRLRDCMAVIRKNWPDLA